MPPKVSLFIPTRNGWHHLEQCLPSLEKLSYPRERLEIVVIDNDSTDETTDRVNLHFPRVHILRNQENLGFAPALNRASLDSQSQYLAFLNDDTRVDSNWLSLLIDALESQKKENAVAACGTILDWEGREVQFFGGHINFVGKAFHHRPTLEQLDASPSIQPTFYTCGAGMVINRKTFLDSGGFDIDYFMIYEDVDLGWRLNLSGLQSLLVRDAKIYHRESASLSHLDYKRKALWWERNALWTIYKNYEDSNLEKIWPAALALAFKRDRILLEAGRKEDYESHHQGVMAAVETLEHYKEKRTKVQNERKVEDRKLLQFFPEPFRPWAYGEDHSQLFSEGEYEEFFQDCLDRFKIRSIFEVQEGVKT